jgi:hypothetical protein
MAAGMARMYNESGEKQAECHPAEFEAARKTLDSEGAFGKMAPVPGSPNAMDSPRGGT